MKTVFFQQESAEGKEAEVIATRRCVRRLIHLLVLALTALTLSLAAPASGAPPGVPTLSAEGGKVTPSRDWPPAVTARIYDVTTARDVAWGQPVGPSTVFTPDVNPIYIWFRHQGFATGTTIIAVWYFTSTAAPTKIGEGTVTVTPPSDWGQFNFELAQGKRWPAGDYRVELLVAGQPAAEARFRVATAVVGTPTPPAPTSATTPLPPGLGQRYTHPRLGYSLTVPAGWTLADDGEDLALHPPGSNGRISVITRTIDRLIDSASFAAEWESQMVGPGRSFSAKIAAREVVTDGERAHEGTYRGDELIAKAVFVTKPERVFLIMGVFPSLEFPARVAEIEQVTETFTTRAAAAAPPPPLKPLSDLLEGLGRILQGR